MLVHGSCAARDGHGVLVVGPPGSGKSDLVLRLLDRGFALVADDQVEVEDGWARPPARLAGLLEVRGLGILRLPYLEEARLSLAVSAGTPDRLPEPHTHLGVPLIVLDPREASAPVKVARALDCAGGAPMVAGAFVA